MVDYIGEYHRGYEWDTLSLDYSSHEIGIRCEAVCSGTEGRLLCHILRRAFMCYSVRAKQPHVFPATTQSQEVRNISPEQCN